MIIRLALLVRCGHPCVLLLVQAADTAAVPLFYSVAAAVESGRGCGGGGKWKRVRRRWKVEEGVGRAEATAGFFKNKKKEGGPGAEETSGISVMYCR